MRRRVVERDVRIAALKGVRVLFSARGLSAECTRFNLLLERQLAIGALRSRVVLAAHETAYLALTTPAWTNGEADAFVTVSALQPLVL